MDNPIARALGLRPERSLVTLIDHEAELAFDLDYYPRAAATWETVFEADVTEMVADEVVKVVVPAGAAFFTTYGKPLAGKLLRKF